MKARVAIQIGVQPAEWRLLKKAAANVHLPLATYVRQAAVATAERQLGAEARLLVVEGMAK